MKKLVLTLLISTIAFSSFSTKSKQKKNSKKQTKNSTQVKFPASEGQGDSRKRTAWEFNRLKDPQTGKIPNSIREKELAFASTLPNDANTALMRNAQAVSWSSRGPFNYGGRTRALAYDLNDETILHAGAVSGGMWRSTNGGLSWNKVSALNVNQSVTCIAQDKRAAKRNVWYYGSGEAYGASASGGSAFHLGSGVFKSTNNGLSWTKLTSTGASTPQTFDNVWDLVWNVATDSINATQDEVYAATYGGIFRSVNGGTSWSLVRGSNASSPFSYFTDVAVSPTGVVYATLSTEGTHGGIWRSANGTTWTSISPSFLDTANRMVIGINPNNENEVYFLAETPGSGKTTTNYAGTPEQNSLWKYTYVSGNGSGAGGIWEDRSQNLPDNGGIFDKFNSQGGYDLTVQVQPGNSNLVVIGGTNLFRSTDAFTSSSNTSQIGGYGIGSGIPFYTLYPNHHPDQHGVLFSQTTPNQMYSACDGGVFKTIDITAQPVVWNSLNQGYLSTQFYTLAIDPATAGDSVIIAGAQDNGTLYSNSLNPNFSWTQPSLGDGSYCAIADGGSNYYYSRQEGKLIKTTMGTNGLTTGYVRIDPLMADTNKYGFIAPFVLDPNNNNNLLYLTCGDMIYRNSDLSQIAVTNSYYRTNQNWDSLSFTRDSTANITAIAISKTPANRLYYGTNRGKIYRIDNANSGNPVPVNISSSTLPLNAYVSCIAIDPSNADKVLLVFSNYNIYSLFYTSDGGTTWAKVAGNLEANTAGTGVGASLRWASIMPLTNGTAYFVATSTGVYATDTLNGLATVWTQQGTSNLGSVVCDVIVSRSSDGLVVIGTHGNGIYTATLTDINQLITGIDFKNTVSELDLKNYPNPFSQKTTLEYTVKEAGIVELQLLDELGKTVRIFESKYVSPGTYTEILDRKDLTSGLYYCSLTLNKKRIVKMLLAE
jgi:hypothetical protein